MAEILIDSYLCSGCGGCVELCPQVFCLNPHTEKAELCLIDPAIDDEVRQAAAFCPEQCIEIQDTA